MRIPSKTVFVAALMFLAAPLFAAGGGFISTLSAEQQASTGVTTLTEQERDVLNTQVASEVALARQGDVKGFAGTFSSRRSAEERKASGIDRLNEDQVAELDRLVATMLAAGPVEPRASRLLTSEQVSKAHKRFETHGSVSYTIGASSGGGSFQGGSVSTMLLDTKTGSSIEFTYSQFKGDPLALYGAGYLYGTGAGCYRTGRGPVRFAERRSR